MIGIPMVCNRAGAKRNGAAPGLHHGLDLQVYGHLTHKQQAVTCNVCTIQHASGLPSFLVKPE